MSFKYGGSIKSSARIMMSAIKAVYVINSPIDIIKHLKSLKVIFCILFNKLFRDNNFFKVSKSF